VRIDQIEKELRKVAEEKISIIKSELLELNDEIDILKEEIEIIYDELGEQLFNLYNDKDT